MNDWNSDNRARFEAEQAEALRIHGPTAPLDPAQLKADCCLWQHRWNLAKTACDRAQERLNELRQEASDATRRAEEAERKLARATNAETLTIPTPEQITRRILAGSLDPDQARSALYALQVSLTAKRTEHLIAAQRQKEERLRSHKQSPPKPRTRSKKTRSKKRT